jgi:hypothetical protein
VGRRYGSEDQGEGEQAFVYFHKVSVAS